MRKSLFDACLSRFSSFCWVFCCESFNCARYSWMNVWKARPRQLITCSGDSRKSSTRSGYFSLRGWYSTTSLMRENYGVYSTHTLIILIEFTVIILIIIAILWLRSSENHPQRKIHHRPPIPMRYKAFIPKP